MEYKPTVKLPTLQTNQDLLALRKYFTRSKVRPKRPRTNRRPRNASFNIDYEERKGCSDVDTKRKPRQTKNTLPADGPTATRVHAQSSSTGIPGVCLPVIKSNKKPDEQEEVPFQPAATCAPTETLKKMTII